MGKDHLIKEDVVTILVEHEIVDASQIGGMINQAYNVIIAISLVIMPQNVTSKRNMRKSIMLTTKKSKMMRSY